MHFTHFGSPGLSRSLLTHGSGKQRDLSEEDRSELPLLSIDDSVQIIIDD